MFVEAITIFYKITNSILFSNKSNVYKAKNFQIIHLEIDYASVTPFGYVIHQLASKLAHLSSVSDHTLEFRTQPVKEEKESVQKNKLIVGLLTTV